MNQRLAVKAEINTLPALVDEPVGIADVVVNAIEDINTVNARGRDAHRKPGQHGRSPRHQAGACILCKVVGAHHKSREARFGVARFSGDREDIEYRERRFDHRPDPRFAIGTHIEQTAADQLQRIRTRHFRHQDDVRRRTCGS